jgi:rare lipoprotein A
MPRPTLAIGLALAASAACACPSPTTTRASYYGSGFQGRRTASGRIFHQGELTAAHRSCRFGTQVRVTNLRNGRNVVVTITDRGPYVRGRGLDLSVSAARAIGATGAGVVSVRLDPLCEAGPNLARAQAQSSADSHL